MGGGVCCAKNKNWENKQLIQMDQPLTWIILCSKIFKMTLQNAKYFAAVFGI